MERRGKSALFSNFLSDVINTLSIGYHVDKKKRKRKKKKNTHSDITHEELDAFSFEAKCSMYVQVILINYAY